MVRPAAVAVERGRGAGGRGRRSTRGGIGDSGRIPRTHHVDRTHPVVPRHACTQPGMGIGGGRRVRHQIGPVIRAIGRHFNLIARDRGAPRIRGRGPTQVDRRLPVLPWP